ncbi:MAG: endonuclease [Alphaproteobacteria bacterium]|nr:endonuclease [Alphaproteobacteria bacterium]
MIVYFKNFLKQPSAVLAMVTLLGCLFIMGLPAKDVMAESKISFAKSKKILSGIYKKADQQRTFYCGCDYTSNKEIDYLACGYTVRKNQKRAQRIEWEHVVPASRLGSGLACWQSGHPECVKTNGDSYAGRRCCRKVDANFKKMEADMHNLVPAIGEVNGDRSNFRMAELAGESDQYGQCDFEVDFKQRLVEPKPKIRGEIARIYLYMHQKYGIGLTTQEEGMYSKWALDDPVSDWEIDKNGKVAAIQGDVNSFIPN